MNALSMNGRKRPTLSEQIGRLDTILDGLADTLNEAVALAVKEAVGIAVKEAVQSILTEVLANQELLAKLRPEPAKTEQPAPVRPPAEKEPSWWARLTGLATIAWKKVANVAKFVWGKIVGAAKQAKAKVARAAGFCWRKIRTCWTIGCSRVTLLAAGSWVMLRGVALMMWQFRKPLLIALGVGSAVGVCCYLAGPVVSSTVSGMAGFAGALFGSAVNGLRKAFAGMDMQNV